MKSMVDIIKDVENNIKELTERNKEIEKALKELTEEKKLIVDNLAMYDEVLTNLTGIKEKEINQEIKGESKSSKNMTWLREAKSVILIDEKGNTIAEYKSQHKAGKDLGLDPTTVGNRIRNISKERQIKRFGYALISA